MMSDQEYAERLKACTVRDLDSIINGIDRERFSERYKMVLAEKALRTQAGEIVFQDAENRFWARNVSVKAGLAVWWLITWRTLLSFFLVVLPAAVLYAKYAAGAGTAKYKVILVNLLIQFGLSSIFGIFFTRQAMANQYQDFELEIKRRPPAGDAAVKK